ncbi:hypothetical protein NX059_000681 [Plenodomus lindquistii]|nr:hypothetical protein NX059_000681 [Plenodomus lindquistii]
MGQVSTTPRHSPHTYPHSTTPPIAIPDPAINTSYSSPPPPPIWITLTCNTKSFPVRRSLLLQHRLFANHFSVNPHDTSINLAALHNDEEIALHIVTYLSDPSTFPFFRSALTGFHYALYQHLQKAAAALELWDLHDWIKEENYLGALKTVIQTRVDEVRVGQYLPKMEYEGDVDVSVEMAKKTRYWHFCPRGVPAHRVERGRERRCGRRCEGLWELGMPRLEEEQYVEVVTVAKRVVFDAEVCRSENAVDTREGEEAVGCTRETTL